MGNIRDYIGYINVEIKLRKPICLGMVPGWGWGEGYEAPNFRSRVGHFLSKHPILPFPPNLVIIGKKIIKIIIIIKFLNI